MNCKQGDLAVVVIGPNSGGYVRVNEQLFYGGCLLEAWRCEALNNMRAAKEPDNNNQGYVIPISPGWRLVFRTKRFALFAIPTAKMKPLHGSRYQRLHSPHD